MQRRRPPASQTRRAGCTLPGRAGFTLIELIVVVTIIIILVSLLIPAVGGALYTGRVTHVKTELTALESAIANFQNQFGTMPPGRITLWSSEAEWNANPKDKAVIRQLFPQFDFVFCGGAPWLDPMHSAMNANVTPDKTLTGAECLVFFLGGVPSSSSTPGSISLNGFSRSPTQPFSTAGNSRVGPFFNFVNSRFVDRDSDGALEYCDPMPSQQWPILYFSSNDGRQYSTRSDSMMPTIWCHTDNWADEAVDSASGNPGDTGGLGGGNWMRLAYTTAAAATAATVNPWQPKKYQLISPGIGGTKAGTALEAYGLGGVFNPDATTDLNDYDADNISNFHTGTLGGR